MKMKAVIVIGLLAALGAAAYIAFWRPSPHQALRIVVSAWPLWDLMRVAKDRGYFKQEGVEIELLRLTSNEDILRAVENKSADVAFLGLDMCVRLNSRGVPCKMVLITDISKGSEGIITRKTID